MRFRKVDRYLLLLAGCFVVALLRTRDLPGEAVLPEAHRAFLHAPLLLPLARELEDPSTEVERLRTELEAARHEIENLRRDFDERGELRAYFREVLWPRPPVGIPGWVVKIERNPYRRVFTIDVGSDRGVAAGMAVVCGRALLGRIESVERRSATVQRIDDPGFQLDVAVRVGDETVPGIVGGDNAGGLELEFVGAGRRLTEGATVWTSSYDAQVPPDLLVGRITSIEDPDRDLVDDVYVEPAAPFGRLAMVTVLQIRGGAR